MRIALLFSGHLRSFELTYETFRRTILENNEVDVFCTTWETVGWWTGDFTGAHINPDMNFVDVSKFKDHYNPVVFDIQNYFSHYRFPIEKMAETYADILHDKRIRLINPLSMYYKMQRVINLFEDYLKLTSKEYDVVIRTRPDIILDGFAVEVDPDPELVIIDGSKGVEARGAGDMLQMGTTQNILKFNRLFDDYEETMRACTLYDPHLYIEKYMHMKGIKFRPLRRFTLHNAKNGQYAE